jgi:hypothetical protein
MQTKKLSLDVDALAVESFDAQTESGAARGTVQGNAFTALCTQYDRTCHGYGTCNIYPCQPIP